MITGMNHRKLNPWKSMKWNPENLSLLGGFPPLALRGVITSHP